MCWALSTTYIARQNYQEPFGNTASFCTEFSLHNRKGDSEPSTGGWCYMLGTCVDWKDRKHDSQHQGRPTETVSSCDINCLQDMKAAHALNYLIVVENNQKVWRYDGMTVWRLTAFRKCWFVLISNPAISCVVQQFLSILEIQQLQVTKPCLKALESTETVQQSSAWQPWGRFLAADFCSQF